MSRSAVLPATTQRRRFCQRYPWLCGMLRAKPDAWFLFLLNKDDCFMATLNPGDLIVGNQRAFVLLPQLPKSGTFVEPTVVVTPTTAGAVTLQPSVAGTPGSDGTTPYTTAGVFVPATGFTGTVTLSADVLGVDNQDATFSVVPAPLPETVAFDPTKFADTPVPPATA